MEETLFEATGEPVAYIDYDDDATIYLWNGKPVAYIDSDNCIYGFNGKHLGWFEDGIVWNLKGERNGYNKNTLPVFPKFEPFKSFKQFKPFKSFKEYQKYKPSQGDVVSKSLLVQLLIKGIL